MEKFKCENTARKSSCPRLQKVVKEKTKQCMITCCRDRSRISATSKKSATNPRLPTYIFSQILLLGDPPLSSHRLDKLHALLFHLYAAESTINRS